MIDIPAERHQYLRQTNQVSIDTVEPFPTADRPSIARRLDCFVKVQNFEPSIARRNQ